MKNKKGFTLVELLAVIVILALLATAAFTLVIPRIEKAKKDVFKTEAATFVDAANVYFLEHPDKQSVSIQELLTGNYASVKGNANDYSGVVYWNNGSPTISLSNGRLTSVGDKKLENFTSREQSTPSYTTNNNQITFDLTSKDFFLSSGTTYTGNDGKKYPTYYLYLNNRITIPQSMIDNAVADANGEKYLNYYINSATFNSYPTNGNGYSVIVYCYYASSSKNFNNSKKVTADITSQTNATAVKMVDKDGNTCKELFLVIRNNQSKTITDKDNRSRTTYPNTKLDQLSKINVTIEPKTT